MKILYYFKENATYMYQWQRLQIFDNLSQRGREIKVFNPLYYSSCDAAETALLQEVKANRYDLFMTPHNERDISVDVLQQINSIGIPTLLICFDNLLIPYEHKKIAQYFSLVWLTSLETEYLFRSWHANTVFLPYASNPYYFSFAKETNAVNRCVFLGTVYGSRAQTINRFLQCGADVTLFTASGHPLPSDYGDGAKLVHNIWNYVRTPIGRKVIWAAVKQKTRPIKLLFDSPHLEICDPIPFSQMSAVYANYALSISSSSARNTGLLRHPVHVINLRSFEIPMCGGLQITEFNPELASYFDEDKEIVFYRSLEELKEKAKFYCSEKNSALRIKMKAAARRRAENEHTWNARFDRIFEILGI